MRILVLIVGALALAYGGYWFVGARAAERAGAAAAEELRRRGWQVAYESLDTRGFPSRFDTTATGVDVTTPRGITWQAPFVQALALSYDPDEAIVVWPERQTLAWRGAEAVVESREMRASVELGLGGTLDVETATLEAGPTRIATGPDLWVGFERALAALRPAGGRPDAFDVYAEASGVSLAPALRGSLPAQWPATLDRLSLDGLAHTRDRLLEIEAAELSWGPLALAAQGTLAVTPAGRLDGEIVLAVPDPAALADALEATPLGRAAGLLRSLPDGAELPITLRDGAVRLGPVPLGTLPALR